MQLATVANNPDEQAARSRVLAQYGGNSLLGIAKFAEQYVAAIRGGSSLEAIGQSEMSLSTTAQPQEGLHHVY
ncbi:hypothetical protein [Nodosilinea nodulosa]|uniref:hypothetical protein n=1 Tax=Nodosilinea nodulosa TaxID=416001 RepID=UPI00037BB0D5|nr:hypothetical protein [Nodosilinea nodulosa]